VSAQLKVTVVATFRQPAAFAAGVTAAEMDGPVSSSSSSG
jgi:hypothetical protein